MKPTPLAAILSLCLLVPVGLAGPITNKTGLTGEGSFDGTFTYTITDETHATVIVTLKNTGSDDGSFLTAFAFNNPDDLITDVGFSSSNGNFQLLGGTSYQNGVNAAPFGQFDIGAGLGDNWEGGGTPSDGLAANVMATFTFNLTGIMLNSLTEEDFFNALSAPDGDAHGPEAFIVRFRGGAEGDKVPGAPGSSPTTTTNQTPEPASLVLAGIGAGCMLLNARRFRKRETAEKLA
jgi:hypothetical protein